MLTETELRDKLKELLSGVVKPPYFIDTEVPIPYKHIYIPTDNKTKLELWCFKQDITIFKILFEKNIKQKDTCISNGNDILIELILEKDSSQNSHPVGLPLVILELKKSQPNTHEILTYSQKAEMIKTIFPYCQFLFLIQGNIAARTYRHGINFDEIISLKNVNDDQEIKNLKATLKKHFDIATKKINLLKETKHKKKVT